MDDSGACSCLLDRFALSQCQVCLAAWCMFESVRLPSLGERRGSKVCLKLLPACYRSGRAQTVGKAQDGHLEEIYGVLSCTAA